ETAVAVNLDEPCEQPLDEAIEARTIRVARHLDALPGRERRVDFRAQDIETMPQRVDRALVGVCTRQGRDRVELFQQLRDRRFEIQRLRHRVLTRSLQGNRPVSDDLLDLGDEGRRGPHADLLRYIRADTQGLRSRGYFDFER